MKAKQKNNFLITVQYEVAQKKYKLLNEDEIKQILREVLPADAEVTVRFVDQQESQATNLRFRQKNYPTDVLSFTYSKEDQEPLVGDIMICPDIVIKDSKQAKIDLNYRYRHLLVHAGLHLLGMEHDNKKTKASMEKREAQIMQSLGLPAPYA